MNKIYKTIWSHSLGTWVVTSEFGRGKIKSSSSKTLAGIGLGLSLLSASVLSAPNCNSATLICDLTNYWDYTYANSGAETMFVNDGKNYTVNGPGFFNYNTLSGKIQITVDDAIDQGYITNTTEKMGGKSLVAFGNRDNIVVVTDPLSGVTSTVNMYDSDKITQNIRDLLVSVIDLTVTSAPYYYQAGFVKVTDGQATINVSAPRIEGSFKDTQLASAVSTTSDAKVTWASDNIIAQGENVTSATQEVNQISYSVYADSITAFDGSTIEIKDLAGLKNYNNWLVEQVRSGKLAGTAYDSQLDKVYTVKSVTYLINPVPAYSTINDPILTADIGIFAPLHASGSKATAVLTGSLTGSVNYSDNFMYSMMLLENGSTGINQGTLSSWGYGYGVIVKSGSTFINQGLINNNDTGSVVYLSRIDGQGSHYINDTSGVVNLSPMVGSGIDISYGFFLSDDSKITNKGIINFSDADRADPGQVIGIAAINGTFDNQGLMTLGLKADGTAVNTSVESLIVYIAGTNGANTNSGRLVLGEKAQGSMAVRISHAGNADFTNSGTIDILGEKSETAASNIGISAVGRTYGIDNSGTINVKGTNNIGLHVYNGAQASSSGDINVVGKQTTNKLNNFGVWVESLDSVATVSGAVNVSGDNAIAIHAKNQGQINLTGNGRVTFSDGENQIGYYIYGAGSKINNTGTGTQDVTTNNSTLMRLAGGAAFTGSSDATSTMSASGDNSTVIVATGTGTIVDSGGMTVNVNGKNTTGFLVEGGATGKIGTTTTIKLAGEGAIAGIADGQGHDRTGAEKVMTDEEKKATSLTASANLNSDLNNVTGYIARNLATLTNAGNITFSGNNATGIQVEEGTVGANSGNITLEGRGSVGLKATANTLLTTLSSIGHLTLNGSWDGTNDATRTTGVLADGSQVAVTIGDGIHAAAVNLNGTGSVGVHATAGSTVTINDKVTVNFDSDNADQIAFWVRGSGSEIVTQASTTPTNVQGDGATLFYITDTATMNGALNLTLSGKAGSDKTTSGIRVNGAGSLATLATGSQLTISSNATGVLAENAGQALIDAGTAFNISGDKATVGKATGGNSRVENNAAVTSGVGSSGSTAFLAGNGGTIDNRGNINLSVGANHTAIDLNNGHLVNTGNIQANGTAIHIKGSTSTIANTGAIEAVGGKAAIHVDEGAGLNLSAVSGGTGTIKAGGTADGILLSEGALSLNVANTIIDMSDVSASGIGINNVAGIGGIALDNTRIKLGGTGIGIKTGASLAQTNSGQIDVTDGAGILYLNEDGSAVASDLDFSDSTALTINVSGSGIGVKATLDGQDRVVNTGASVNINNAGGGSAIDVSGAKSVTNSGNLLSQSTVIGGSVLNVHDADVISNSGTIAASSAMMTAIAMSNTGNKTLTNTGDITGLLDFATGDNLINLTGGTMTGTIRANGGANTLTASAGSVHTGTVTLAGNNANTVNVNGVSALGNLVMTGSGNHQVAVKETSSTGTMTLGNGANTISVDNSTVTDISVGNGNNSITLQNNAHINSLLAANGGENTVLIKGNATFGSLDAGTGGANNSLTFDGTDYTLANTADILHFDVLNLTNGSDFTTNQLIRMGDTGSSSGRITIDSSSSLILTTAGEYTLNHGLSGTGLIDVRSGTIFDFGDDAGNQFAGNVQMNSADFTLSGLNTAALNKAILSVMGNNTTTVGSGVQRIGGLIFNGGTVDFGVNIPNALVSDHFIQADTLDANGTGQVQVVQSNFNNATIPVVNQTLGLLDQQTDTLVRLAGATTVTGSAGNLVLTDENGNVISKAAGTTIYQNGIHAADGHYDYRLTTTDNSGNANGLYVGYGLTQLDLLTNGINQLVINTAHSTEKVLSVKLTGSGDLGIMAGTGADGLVLSNLDNSYTGVTDLQSGTITLGTDSGFGATSTLRLANTTMADINGKTQTIGALDGKVGSTLNLNGGDLTLTNGGTSAGTLTGGGDFTVAGGTLAVRKANAGLSATTTVNAGAQALLADVLALGIGNVVANGDVTLDSTSGTFANAVSGSGQLNSYNGSAVTLSGNNTGFSGVMEIDTTSTLTISETQHVGGTTAINNNNQFIANNSAAITLVAIINGTGDLIKTHTGTLTLSGTNTYTGNTDIQGGTVVISADANLGNTANQTRLNGGVLQIIADLTSARDVTLVQNGSVIVDGGVTATMGGWDDQTGGTGTITKAGDGTLIWSGDNSLNTATISVTDGTLQVGSLNNLASANGVVNLGADGRLSILKTVAANVDFTRQLSGSGELLVYLGDKAQKLSLNTSSAGGNFTGRVTMDNGRFMFNTDADATLAQATLQLNGGAGKLGSTQLTGNHTIDGLTMNGGQLEVEYSNLDHRPEGLLTVNTLDVVGGGNLAITTPGHLPNPIPVTGASLFDQDDGVYDAIVKATGSVNGVGTQIAVTDVNGAPVAPDTLVGLVQGGTTAGNAHYNYFGAVKDDGLYLGYGLTQLDAFVDQSVILDNSHATDNALGAKLTGDGGFTVNATGTVRIGNATSDYIGATDLNSGNVELITHNGLGQTSQLNMQSGTGLDLNGNRQIIGILAGQTSSVINLNGGELTITNGGQTDGTFTGQGQLILTGNTLNLNQNSSYFTGTTKIQNGATARLTQPQGLGQGSIHIDNTGTLNLDSARGTLLNSLNGSGETVLTNGADMSLGGNNTSYSGTFTTNADTILTATEKAQLGTAVIDNSGTFAIDTTGLWTLNNIVSGSGTFVKKGTGTVQLEANNVSAGLTDIENGLLLIGGLPAGSAMPSVAMPLAASTPANLTSDVIIREGGALGGYGSVTGNVTNSGNLIMGHALTGAGHGEFTIDGHYTGTDTGTLIFNTSLDGDTSSTDLLRITGDTTGTGKVVVMSARGEGAQTKDGIKLIDVQGSSDAQFSLSGRAVAGAYEYFLYQGGIAVPADGHWYLRSSLNPDFSVYRPEAAGYMANMAAAGNLFRLRLEDREGRAENTSMWLRQAGSRNKHRDNTGQLHTATNSYVVQGGGEVFGTETSDTGRFGLGVMAAYGKADSKSISRVTGYQANSRIDGYSTGIYGTWYQDAQTLNGAYVDSWVQYSWLNAEVNGQETAKESYDMNGVSASVEAGYRLPVYQGLNSRVFITPQAQITRNGIQADDHTEVNGSRVSSSGHDNVQTRLGMKVSRDGVSDNDQGRGKLFTVYGEVNWLYNSQQAGAVLDGVEVKQSGSRHVGELKLGAEGQLNSHLNLWSNVSQQLGDNGYSDTAVTLGVKVRF